MQSHIWMHSNRKNEYLEITKWPIVFVGDKRDNVVIISI